MVTFDVEPSIQEVENRNEVPELEDGPFHAPQKPTMGLLKKSKTFLSQIQRDWAGNAVKRYSNADEGDILAAAGIASGDMQQWPPPPATWSDRAKRLIESDNFEVTIGVVVMLNVAIIAADSEVRITGNASSYTERVIKRLDVGCLVVYTAELVLKIWVYGKELLKQLYGWTGFDALLVLLGILGEIIESEVQMFLMLRIVKALRAFRILRAVRSLGFMKPLLMVLHDFGGMIKLLFGGFIILLLLPIVISHPDLVCCALSRCVAQFFFSNSTSL